MQKISLAYFDEILQLLREYAAIYDFRNIDFFVNEQWKKLPSQWFDYMKELSIDQLNALPIDGHLDEGCPNDLRQLISASHRLSLLGEPEQTRTITKQSKIGAKKSHELVQLVQLVEQLCIQHRINRIVDIGCGLGHLLTQLSKSDRRIQLVGIECDEQICSRASRSSSSIGIIVEHLRFTIDDEDDRLTNVLLGNERDRTALISLHGCGDLQPAMLKWMTRLDRSRVPILVTVPCCYHKMQNSGAVSEWPISTALHESEWSQWSIGVSGLRLACQERRSRWTRQTLEDHEKHKRAFIARGIAESLGVEITRTDRKILQQWRNFDELKQELSMFTVDERNFDEIMVNYGPSFDLIEPFTALQFIVQPLLESLILADRCAFLQEKGFQVDLKPIFDSAISPRNMCLIAVNNGGAMT